MSEHESRPPYADSREHLLDELVRIELLLRRHVESLWSDPGTSSEGGGFYVSAEEVERLLATDPREKDNEGIAGHHEEVAGQDETTVGGSGAESCDDRPNSHRQAVSRRASRALDAGVELRLIALTHRFELSPLEVDVLLLALAPDLDTKYGRVYGYLHDDITAKRPTIDLLLEVLSTSKTDRLALLELFEPRSRLVRTRLLRVGDGATIPSSPVRVDRRILEYLLGSDAIAAPIADAASLVDPTDQRVPSEGKFAELAIDADQRRTLESVAERLDRGSDAVDERAERATQADGASHDRRAWTRDATSTVEEFGLGDDSRPLIAAFVGPDERTADAAVVAACSAAGIPILRVDARALPHDALEETLAIVRMEARLRDAAIQVREIDALESDTRSSTDATGDHPARDETGESRLDRLVAELDTFGGDVFLTGDAGISARLQPRLTGHELIRIAFPRPEFAQRRALWRDVDGLPPGVDPASLAATYRLTRGEIEDVIATARSLGEGTLTAVDVREACRLHSRQDLDQFATAVDLTYGWDDIVLPADTLAHLREIAASVRHRGTVYEKWGFAERFGLGNGINVLFTGPSGTGKTMAAEIIAGDVGLPLYKLDLAQILSKYIGETEENLGRIFDAAEHSNAILFFDEADALFGKRTEVSDSHDRYANVEVDYLLQRMEEHDGCVILASNLEENIDDAFLRRINATVTFSIPDADAREEIWRSIFPDDVPRGDVDTAFLSRFEFSGGFIKNVALTAAFMAADDDGPLEMTHVVRALRREFQKTGKLLDRDEFGPYRDLLE